MKYLYVSLLFSLLFILQLTAVYYQIHSLQQIVLSVLGLSMTISFIYQTKLKGRFHKRILIGLLLAFLGQFFLLQSNKNPEQHFYGFAILLLSHILYTTAFYLDFRSAPQLDKKGAKIAISVVFIFCITYYLYFRAHLGPTKVPFLAHSIVISFMMMMSAFRHMRVNYSSFKLVLMGTVLFLLSDVLATTQYFFDSNLRIQLLTAATFMAAQYLIIIGSIERKLNIQD